MNSTLTAGQPFTRVSFENQGQPLAGWLFHPPASGTATGLPAIVMAHGFAGTVDENLCRFAARFANAGFLVLAFDYRSFGASAGWPRQVLDIAAQHSDWRAAIAWIRTHPACDPERVVLWGTSFSGGHVQQLAAHDSRIKAIVAQVPFADGRANTGAVWQALRLIVAALRDRWRAWRRSHPYYIGAVGHPGTLAVMTSADAMEAGLTLSSPRSSWENRVAARIILQILNYRPGLEAGQIRCPVLYQLADKDVVTPPQPVLDAARRAALATVIHYAIEHFEIYQGEPFERSVADQLEFLSNALGSR